MPTAAGCAGRRQRLWAALPGAVDALILYDARHLAYLAGYAPSPFTFRTAGGGALLVMTSDRATLIGDNLLGPFLDEAHVDEVRTPTWYDGLTSPAARLDVLVRNAVEILAMASPRRLGLEGATASLALVEGLRSRRPDLELIEVAPTLHELRRAKDPDEVDAIRRALHAAEAGMAAALEGIRPGMNEIDAFRLIEAAALDALGQRALIYGDFVSGPDLQRRLGPPTTRTMQAGDFLLMDFSVVVRGYRGDIANTLVVGGSPSAKQSAWHQACVGALAAGEAMLRPGMSCRVIEKEVRRALQEFGGDPDVPGHLGHGIGLDHPEAPFIVARSIDCLHEGDVVTLEPGQYGPPHGGLRVERNYLITAGGPVVLSHHALDLG
jgi:Xaa-Pro aminopeptidase